MSTALLNNFKKETGIEVTKEELVNLRHVYEKVFFQMDEKSKKNLEGNFQRWTERNLVNIKLTDADGLYFEENKDYIKTAAKTKGRPRIDYYITPRTAELILLRSGTLLGRTLLNKLLDLVKGLNDFKANRHTSRINYKPMCEAINEAHDPPQFYHFCNEADMINKIVTGLTAKQFREVNGVDNIRDNLTPEQIKAVDKLQIINTGLIEVGESFEVRKARLSEYFNRKLSLVVDNTGKIAQKDSKIS